MSILDKLLGAGPVGAVIDKLVGLIPDPAAQARAKAEAEREIRAQEAAIVAAMQAGDAGQIEVNKIEAAHASLFVAGWRPAVGWVCVTGLGYQWLAKPVIEVVTRFWIPDYTAGSIDTVELLALLGPMLGLATLRTLEKRWGVSRG